MPPAERQARGAVDNCVECHMPRSPLADIAHTVATDHRIPRGGRREPTPERSLAPGGDDSLPIVLYHADHSTHVTASGVIATWRSRGAYGPRHSGTGRGAVEQVRLAPAGGGGASVARDVAATDALATALALQNHSAEALETAKAVLAVEPGRERALDLAMVLASQLHHRDEALDFGRRTLAVDPWLAQFSLAMREYIPGATTGARQKASGNLPWMRALPLSSSIQPTSKLAAS